MAGALRATERALIANILAAYAQHRGSIKLFHDQLLSALQSSQALGTLVHSVRSRLKDPEHLREKLARKVAEHKSRGEEFQTTPENFLEKVTDLVGVRLLHLHTRQIRLIDAAIRDVFNESRYELIQGPFARTWDDESRDFFEECKIETQRSPSMYTSVHYIIGSASRTRMTAEIQVRTLMEEVWGEVDHTVNYPNPCDSLACREQLKVLARVTSSASRLVDSVFATVADHNLRKNPRRKSKDIA